MHDSRGANFQKCYRYKEDVRIDFLTQHERVKTGMAQHDKAHLSANKLAVPSHKHCQKHDYTHALHTHRAVLDRATHLTLLSLLQAFAFTR